MSLETKHAILDALQTVLDADHICSIVGCGKKRVARGLCSAHWKRSRRHGDPLAGGPIGIAPGTLASWIEQHKNDENGPCLTWPFGLKENGYGQATLGNGRKGYAHRIMCEAAHGPPPFPKAEAAHSCGNGTKACVHPKHIRWATHIENEADKLAHGTSPRGERHANSRLTSRDVSEIRRMAGKVPQIEIARLYGVRRQHVSDIVCRRKWAWLEDAA